MSITTLSSRQFNQGASKARIADLLAMPGIADLDVDLQPSRDLAQPADLS